MGRLVPQKNHKFLIKAFSLFHKIHTEYHLNIYGIGPLLDELQNLVKKLNLVEYIHFKGFFEEIHEQIKMLNNSFYHLILKVCLMPYWKP